MKTEERKNSTYLLLIKKKLAASYVNKGLSLASYLVLFLHEHGCSSFGVVRGRGMRKLLSGLHQLKLYGEAPHRTVLLREKRAGWKYGELYRWR